MVRKLLLGCFIASLLFIVGCFSLQVDEPLVDLGDNHRHVGPIKGEPQDQAAKIQWLRNQLESCQRRLAKKERENDKLEDKLDRCEDKLDKCKDRHD